MAFSGWFLVMISNNVPFFLKCCLGSCCSNSLVSEGPAVIWVLLLVGTENTHILKLGVFFLPNFLPSLKHHPVSKMQMIEPSTCLLLPGQARKDDSHAGGDEMQRLALCHYCAWYDTTAFACSLAFSFFWMPTQQCCFYYSLLWSLVINDNVILKFCLFTGIF